MKKVFQLLLAFICMTLCLLIPMNASAGSYMEKETEHVNNDSYETAEEINCSVTVNGKLDYNAYYDLQDCYKFSVPQEGKLDLKFTTTAPTPEQLTIYVYKVENNEEDEYGNVSIETEQLWKGAVWDKVTTSERTLYLTDGEYYIQIYLEGYWRLENVDGRYSVDLSFEQLEDINVIDNESWDTPFELEADKEYKAMGTAGTRCAHYRIDMEDPGVVDVNIASSTVEFRCYAYTVKDNMTDKNFKTKYTSKDNETGLYNLNMKLYLDEGSYHFLLDDAYSNNIEGFDYKISYTYTPAKRTSFGIHDTWEEARDLNFDTKYYGFVSLFRNQFYYKITLPSTGILNLNVENDMQSDYDGSNGKSMVSIYEEEPELDDYENPIALTNETENIYLKKGTYYILFQQYSSYLGSYAFNPTFTANATFEDGDDMDTANKIYVGDTVKGQLSVNDKQDVYVFELSDKQDISMNYENDLSSYSTYALYDSDKNYVAACDFDAGKCGEPYAGTWNIGTLEAGCYYLVKNDFFMYITSDAVGSYQFQFVYGNNKPIVTDGVSLNKTSVSLLKGTTYALKATVTPADAADQSVTWSSSNEKVATVTDNGLVKAIAAGKATITVTTNDTGKTAKCVVAVTDPVKTKSVALNKSAVSLVKGNTYTLKATVKPATATNTTVKWKSSNTKVATVSSSGKITAKGYGKATITVTTKDTGKKDTCVVTVKPAVPKNYKLKKTSTNVKLSWTKMSDVTGYKIYRSTKKNSGYELVKTIKKPGTVTYSARLSSLKKKTTYYYKIVAYKTVKINGKNVQIQSNYSSYKSVKR